MDALTKKLLNSLSCPICKAPIDVVNWQARRMADFACAYDVDHFNIKLNDGYISKESVAIYDKNCKYVLIKEYKDLQVKTKILIYDTDPENRVNFSFDDKNISTDLNLFDFRNFDKDKALQRIKTYLLFQ